jgi:hypothetical protein
VASVRAERQSPGVHALGLRGPQCGQVSRFVDVYPDGSSPANLFGNYTMRPWACYRAKAVPGSDRILLVAGGHHANVGGTLVLFDPSRAGLSPRSGEGRFDALEWPTPEVCIPEAQGWPRSYFYSPWPLSETHYLVAFSHDPLSGGYTGRHQESETGLYNRSVFGSDDIANTAPVRLI